MIIVTMLNNIFSDNNFVTHYIFELIHLDIWGPFSVASVHGHRYFLTVIDDFSRHTWVFLMKNKSETRFILDNFVIYIWNQFNRCIKIMRTDNGSEFNYKELYDKFDIMHQTSCVETPQQNVVVERKHQHILNIARSIMFHSNMPKQYWSYVVCHAIFIINHIPSATMQFQIAYELLDKQKPNISFLKVFGCLCFVSTLTNNRNEFDPRSRKCIFLGFKAGVKGYIMLDVKTREIFISRDVIFHEDTFVQKENSEEPTSAFEHDFWQAICENTCGYTNDNKQLEEEIHADKINADENTNEDVRRSTRQRKEPSYLKDYHHQISNSMKVNTKNAKVKYPIDSVLSYDHINKKQLCLITFVSSHIEPKSYEEASQIPEWKKVMQDEINALKDNKTWIITKLPPGKTSIGCRWVYKLKFNAKGEIE